MSTSAAIATLLADAGFGTLAVDIVVGGLQDGDDVPSSQTTVGLYNGITTDTFGGSERRPMLQVMHRGNPGAYLAAEQKCEAMWDYLAAVSHTTVTSVTVDGEEVGPIFLQAIMPSGTVMPLGRDGSDRPLFSMNFEVTT